jgi:hypothetical protein
MPEVFDCSAADGLALGVAAAAQAVRDGQVVVLPTDTVYGIGVRRLRLVGCRSGARRQRSRARDAAAGARARCAHDRRAGSRGAGLRARAHRPVLAGGLDAGPSGAVVVAVGPGGHQRDGCRADAGRPGRPGAAQRDRSDGGHQRQPHRYAARHHRCRGAVPVGGVGHRLSGRRPVQRWAGLDDPDPEIAGILLSELDRLRGGLQLIASENFTSPAVLAALWARP